MAVQGVSSPSNPSESRAKTVTCLHDAIQLYHQAITYLTVSSKLLSYITSYCFEISRSIKKGGFELDLSILLTSK